MRQYLVYLAGPITGLSFEGCVSWREWFINSLPKEIVGLSPMRGKDYLEQEPELKTHYADVQLSSARGITTRDFNDCRRADLIVVNLLGAQKVSIGTVMEIAWAKAFDVPCVLVMEPKGNVHEHPMICESVGFRVETLEEALWLAKVVLLPAPHRRPIDAHLCLKKDFEMHRAQTGLEAALNKCREWRLTDEEVEELLK